MDIFIAKTDFNITAHDSLAKAMEAVEFRLQLHPDDHIDWTPFVDDKTGVIQGYFTSNMNPEATIYISTLNAKY